MKKKLKVVWLCHFSDDEITNILKPTKKVQEFAPWIPISIKTVEDSEEFDVFVIAPYPHIKNTKRFNLRGIHYVFYNPHILSGRLFYNTYFDLDCYTNFLKARRIVRKIVDEIKPDVIHLFGAENAYYSSTILQFFKTYPIIVTVQGFVYKSSDKGIFTKQRIKVEKEILENTKIAFCEAKCLGEDIKMFSPSVKLFRHFYGSYEVTPTANIEKKYDIVFFARICKDKGIKDLIEAIKLLKQKRPNIKACIIGGNKENVFSEYAKSVGLENNIEWTGFLDTREDVHKKAQEGRISVLPTYHDINPGTIIESMFLGIPVVSYDIPSNLEINENGEVIKLVEYKNIEQLAECIANLLDNQPLRDQLSVNARKRAIELFAPSIEESRERLYKGYQEAIKLYYLEKL
jgi:glycosyltransferase involved in cell wall biosynthesis